MLLYTTTVLHSIYVRVCPSSSIPTLTHIHTVKYRCICTYATDTTPYHASDVQNQPNHGYHNIKILLPKHRRGKGVSKSLMIDTSIVPPTTYASFSCIMWVPYTTQIAICATYKSDMMAYYTPSHYLSTNLVHFPHCSWVQGWDVLRWQKLLDLIVQNIAHPLICTSYTFFSSENDAEPTYDPR